MRVMLVKGTWGLDDNWDQPGQGSFADAVVAKGHMLVQPRPRPFVWDTQLGGIGFGDRDLWGWKAAGHHLYDYLVPVLTRQEPGPLGLIIVAHSHARQVVKYACHIGLRASKVIFVSGPVRKDVDERTTSARANIGEIICINGGHEDRWQWLGEAFDGHLGIRRTDPQADRHVTYPDADHSSFLNKPAHYDYVLRHL